MKCVDGHRSLPSFQETVSSKILQRIVLEELKTVDRRSQTKWFKYCGWCGWKKNNNQYTRNKSRGAFPKKHSPMTTDFIYCGQVFRNYERSIALCLSLFGVMDGSPSNWTCRHLDVLWQILKMAFCC